VSRQRTDLRRGRRGQSLVEFALSVPIMLLVFMTIADGGRLLFTYTALEDAAQEGAMYAAHEPSPQNPIKARVKSSSNHPEVRDATVTIACTSTTVAVTATYALPVLTPLARIIFGDTIPMSATFTATNLKGTC
jgi:Flp pilus assembly protein TadG